MFSSIWNFVKRHKRKFIFTGAVVGGKLLLARMLSSGTRTGRERPDSTGELVFCFLRYPRETRPSYSRVFKYVQSGKLFLGFWAPTQNTTSVKQLSHNSSTPRNCWFKWVGMEWMNEWINPKYCDYLRFYSNLLSESRVDSAESVSRLWTESGSLAR